MLSRLCHILDVMVLLHSNKNQVDNEALNCWEAQLEALEKCMMPRFARLEPSKESDGIYTKGESA